MSRRKFLKTVFTSGLIGFSGKEFMRTKLPSNKELVDIWNISGELALEFAEAMPSEDYTFRPAGLDNIYSYGEQMQHIAENNINLISNNLTDAPHPDIELENTDDKSSIIEHIRLSFEYGAEAIRGLSRDEMFEEVNFFARPLPRWHVVFIAQDHTTHHCGQAVVYLNAKGISPPYYRKW